MRDFEKLIRSGSYHEFNNCGCFVIEDGDTGGDYVVDFDSSKRTIETEYPFKEELRKWFFME